jgi:ATP-dependent DNA helicase RecG
VPLTLSSPVVAIDPKVALRRSGFRTKGPEARDVLASAFDIHTVGELLHHYPRRYIDRSRVETIRGLKIGAYATVIATVRKVNKRQTRQRRPMVTVTVGDDTGFLELPFFNQPWAATSYRVGVEVAVSGVAQLYRGRLQLANQEVEVLRGDPQDLVHTGRITPVHPASEGITTRTIRELIWRALDGLPPQPDPMPEEVIAAESLSSWDAALRTIHFPADDRELAAARERLKFDELFTLELGVGFRKQRLARDRSGIVHDPDGALTRALRAGVPFEPTGAQLRAMEDVDRAMRAPEPMNLLLQGDVGSGKTLVAVHACLVAIQSGHQAAVMAPTEVLAGQHARSIGELLRPVGGVDALGASGARPDAQA